MMEFFKKWWDKKRPQRTQTANVQTHETFVRNHTKLLRKTKANQLSTLLETFLTEHYTFRYNVLTEQAEVRALGEKKFRPVTQRVANTLCLEAQEQGIPCWDKDVLRLLNSERLTDYHPLLTYMAELPVWDGIDRITPLAERISTEEIWVNGFHRWMLGVAAQWSGQMDRCANAIAPMLISARQGMGKSTFCRQLVPESLADYYTDSFDLNSQAGCEQKLSLFGLINLDEYDKLSPRKLPLLKNLMQMTSLHYRKAHRAQYSHLPRIASFIGTSNRRDLLNDPTGRRRYLCIEVEEKIENTPLEHKQLFAQLKAELAQGERYWFTGKEEKELMKHNEPYYIQPPMHDVFFQCFRLPEKGEAHQLQTASQLYELLTKRFPSAMRGMNANQFGKTLTLIGAERVHTVNGNVYRVVPVG
ncbi:MAG: DUF3874 domain-containing protein [Bacteroidaceae bacterium]|nr:DUF3874 domain-containing protein [Bacteroidaceae bacterium]